MSGIGEHDHARERFTAALRIMADLARRWPTQIHRFWHAAVLTNLAALWRWSLQRNELEEALRHLEEVDAILQDLVEEGGDAPHSSHPFGGVRFSAQGVPLIVMRKLPNFSFHLENTYSYRGRILFELERDDEALECFRRPDVKGRLDGDSAGDLSKFWAGIDGQALRDPQRAAEIARQGIEKDPDYLDNDCVPALALAQYRLRQYEAARATVKRALRRKRGKGWVFCIAAMIHIKLGEAEAAREAFAEGCAHLDARDGPPTRRMRALRAEAERVLRDG